MDSVEWTCTPDDVAGLRWRAARGWVLREQAGRTLLRLGMYAAIGCGLLVFFGPCRMDATDEALVLTQPGGDPGAFLDEGRTRIADGGQAGASVRQ